jgi:hypothetical protein
VAPRKTSDQEVYLSAKAARQFAEHLASRCLTRSTRFSAGEVGAPRSTQVGLDFDDLLRDPGRVAFDVSRSVSSKPVHGGESSPGIPAGRSPVTDALDVLGKS